MDFSCLKEFIKHQEEHLLALEKWKADEKAYQKEQESKSNPPAPEQFTKTTEDGTVEAYPSPTVLAVACCGCSVLHNRLRLFLRGCIDVDVVADASYRRHQFVPLYLALKKSLRVHDVETGGLVPEFGFFFRAIVLREVAELVRLYLFVRYGVQVALMQVATVARVDTVEEKS